MRGVAAVRLAGSGLIPLLCVVDVGLGGSSKWFYCTKDEQRRSLFGSVRIKYWCMYSYMQVLGFGGGSKRGGCY